MYISFFTHLSSVKSLSVKYGPRPPISGHTRDLSQSTHRPRPANKVFIFSYGIAVKGPKMSKILIRIIKLTFVMTALVIGIHNCLSKIFTISVVTRFKGCFKKLEKLPLSSKFRSGPYSTSNWLKSGPLKRAR